MNRIGNTKLTKGLRLKFQQILTPMVHCTTDATILPTSMFQTRQLIQLLPDFIRRPTLLRKREIPIHIRPTLDKLRLEILNSRGNLLIDLATYTGGAEEERVAE